MKSFKTLHERKIMDLQQILGDAYKEDMSMAEIQEALKGKNFVDLSTGNYVDINKHNREIADLNQKLTNKENEIKTTNDKTNESQSRIEQLEALLKEQMVESNRNRAEAGISTVKTFLDIKDNDTEYNTFIDNVSALDKNVSGTIVSYFSKQIKSAYEKGKTDGTKNSLGDMGKQQTTSANQKDEIGSFGKQLAQSLVQPATYDYFNKNK